MTQLQTTLDPTKLPDEAWMMRLRDSKFTADTDFSVCERVGGKVDPRIEQLKQKLIGALGVAAVMPVIEEDIVPLLERGEFFEMMRVKKWPGEACQCHSNSAAIWDQDQDRYELMTGYGLSEDGVWRQHSWVYDTREGEIIETTTERVVYYGFKMTNDEASKFYWDNC